MIKELKHQKAAASVTTKGSDTGFAIGNESGEELDESNLRCWCFPHCRWVDLVGGITAMIDAGLLISQWLQERFEDGRKNLLMKVEIEQVIIAYDALTVLLIQQTVFLN
jgi:hypothetical protein